jgi:hypothetical protein
MLKDEIEKKTQKRPELTYKTRNIGHETEITT